MSSERKNSRLPPPAFPPGVRRKAHKNSTGPGQPMGDPELEANVFISPDDPLPPRDDEVAKAFIEPDDPLPLLGETSDAGEEGVVMDMGSDPHLDPEELVMAGDPHVMEVAHAVRTLADALTRKGQAGLHATPEMSRFEATLRAYCVGYIAGRRAEDEEQLSEMARRVKPKVEPEL